MKISLNPSLRANEAFLFKRCSKCKLEKPLDEFGRHGQCKKCLAEYQSGWNRDHPKAYKNGLKKSYQWHLQNIARVRYSQKKWTKENIIKVRKSRRQWFKKHYLTPEGKLNSTMGSQIWKALHKNKAGRKWENLVGYTAEDLRKHLESLFLEGMTWENHGKYGWHIDHKIPKSFFVWEKPEDQEFLYCWNLNNLQPLWDKDNLSKGRKMEPIEILNEVDNETKI
jgi:hypothetical protein